MLRKIKNMMPWRMRLYFHIFLAKHPMFYAKAIRQDDTNFTSVEKIFEKHMKYMGCVDLTGKTVCELGPGQSISHAVQAYMAGVSESWFLDIGDLAEKDTMVQLGRFSDVATVRQLPHSDINETWESYLIKINAKYLTKGLKSYYEVPDDSVDYLFSHAVLEHVRRDIFEETIRQTYRMCKQGGLCSHVVDYRDHLGGSINQFRISEEKWESDSYKAMPNYVNRITHDEMLDIFKNVGFEIVEDETKKWGRIPLEQHKMAKPFCDYEYDRFSVYGARVLLRKVW